MLTNNALNGFRDYIKRTVAYAQYRIGSTYYKTDLNKVYVDSAGRVAIEFLIDDTVKGNITVSEIQLIDTSGNVWLSKAENISRSSIQDGIFYRFTVNVIES